MWGSLYDITTACSYRHPVSFFLVLSIFFFTSISNYFRPWNQSWSVWVKSRLNPEGSDMEIHYPYSTGVLPAAVIGILGRWKNSSTCHSHSHVRLNAVGDSSTLIFSSAFCLIIGESWQPGHWDLTRWQVIIAGGNVTLDPNIFCVLLRLHSFSEKLRGWCQFCQSSNYEALWVRKLLFIGISHTVYSIHGSHTFWLIISSSLDKDLSKSLYMFSPLT